MHRRGCGGMNGVTAMAKNIHEIRDPIHVFVRLSSDERKVLDSRPFQRLRYIHQLALTYLVYPGATHKRFEHSLGVMELAGRVYDTITRQENVSQDVRDYLPEVGDDYQRQYWRRAVRMAALCHDLGHLPFSHAAEKELLPEGWTHERLTAEIVRGDEMRTIWDSMKLGAEDIVKLSLGPQEAPDLTFSTWETILSEIIVGDAFGVDRMDYLLRDSHHAGVAYGRFDHYRLVDTLRILPMPPSEEGEAPVEPALGIEEGGLHSAEALMFARYFMFSQVYFHPVRRIYDIHLKDFLREWLSDGQFSTDVESHLAMTDNEVTAAMLAAARDRSQKGCQAAQRIVGRRHFKVVYERSPADIAVNPEAGDAVLRALQDELGPKLFRHDRYRQKGGAPNSPVRRRDDSIESSLTMSSVLERVPVVATDYVFADRAVAEKAVDWLQINRQRVIQPTAEGEPDGMLIPLHQVALQKRWIPPCGGLNWPRSGINYAVKGRREAPPEPEG
jgi:HD superfamily phosphohydrolase